MAISKGLDPTHTERGLTDWLRNHHSDARATDVSIPPGSGGSHETVIFTARCTEQGTERADRLVARVAPVGPGLFPDYDLEREFTLMKSSRTDRSGLPVPAVRIADDLTIAAALDWELACVGAPEFDLAWWLFMNNHHTTGFGLPRPPGMPDDDATVRRYEELTGHPVRDLDFYLVLAGVQVSTLMIRVARLMVDAGLIPAESTMGRNNPAAHMLADLLELPPPDSEQATTFTGVFAERDRTG
jgi:aminoglycoside phosphotransferase (APT) family kinase protein